jgi:AraC-like DNA-binding protein
MWSTLVHVEEPGLGETRQPTTSEYGLLGPPDPGFRLDRTPSSADLADLVERHWLTSWDLPDGRLGEVTLLPHPCLNLIFDGGVVMVAGVGRERFSYPYSGRGRVFGVKFRPGAFLPFLGEPVSRLTDGYRPLATLWGPDGAAALAAELGAAADLDALAAVAERHLRAHRPAPDEEVARVGEIVHVLLHDRSIRRVEEVAERFALSARSLQRLFHRYVGVSPKWVLQRYRLHEAAFRLAESATDPEAHPRWPEVAVELGYFDQSHFIRDFTRAVGIPPGAYVQACAEGRRPLRV